MSVARRVDALRSVQPLLDPPGAAAQRIVRARRPMVDPIRHAWFRYHYVEMRGDPKASKSPINRGDPLAVLLFAARAVGHALRAALLDAARAAGIDEPWLDRGWLHIDASRAAVARLRWE